MNREFSIKAPSSIAPTRLDCFLSESLKTNVSRSKAKRLIREGNVAVNGKTATRPSLKVCPGDRIFVKIPPPETYTLEPVEMDLPVIYEDQWICVIDKPPGLCVHPGAGMEKETLVHGLIHRFDRLSNGTDSSIRPGIVHRLDKDTSGLIVVSKDDVTHELLALAFKERRVKKEYLAVVKGCPEDLEGTVDYAIGRHPVHRKKMSIVTRSPRSALTKWSVQKRLSGATLLSVKIFTGRTHQIRVHMSAIGHPILGDRLYGGPSVIKKSQGKVEIPRQMLHARKLSFIHPKTREWVCFEVPVPEDMQEVIDALTP